MKLYVVIRADMDDGLIAAQACHAAQEFVFEHTELARRWRTESNTIVLLEIQNEPALRRLLSQATDAGVTLSAFYDEDLDPQLTAIALEPKLESRRLCRGLRRAFPPKAA